MDASPVLLEPIVSMKVTVPDKYTGDVMGDLNKTPWTCAWNEPGITKATPSSKQIFRQLEIYGYSTTASFHDRRKRRLLL